MKPERIPHLPNELQDDILTRALLDTRFENPAVQCTRISKIASISPAYRDLTRAIMPQLLDHAMNGYGFLKRWRARPPRDDEQLREGCSILLGIECSSFTELMEYVVKVRRSSWEQIFKLVHKAQLALRKRIGILRATVDFLSRTKEAYDVSECIRQSFTPTGSIYYDAELRRSVRRA